MSEFDPECPRCKVVAQQQASQPAPLPRVTPERPAEPAWGKPAPVKGPTLDLTEPPKRDTKTLALIGLGVAVLLLVGVLLWVLLHKNAAGPQIAGSNTQTPAPIQVTGPAMAVTPKETTGALTSGAQGLAQAPANALTPAATTAGGLANQPKENVTPLTTGAQGLASDEEQSFDEKSVRSWKTVYVTQGSGMEITPAVTVHRPWRIRYYTGQMQEQDIGMFIFAISVPWHGIDAVRVYKSDPNVQGSMPLGMSGTFPLTVAATNSKNWSLAVDQGEF